MIVTLCLPISSCGNSDEPDEPESPSDVTSEKKEVTITCLDSNHKNLPSYLSILYEDSEYRYCIAGRSPQHELILLPYHKDNEEWIPLFTYETSKDVGKQFTPKKYNNEWVCSIVSNKPLVCTSLDQITSKLNFSSNSYLSVEPFSASSGYYGYLTVKGNVKKNISFYCSFYKLDHNQSSSTFGYIINARLEYQFY